MKEINENLHGVCEEMVTSLQATINKLQAKSQDLIRAIDALVDLVTIVENDHYKCDIDSEDCDSIYTLAETDAWPIEYLHGAIRRANQSIAKAKEVKL
jgi:hypothetical protein